MSERRSVLEFRIGRYTIRVRWERKWQDAWIGAYWNTTRRLEGMGLVYGHVWICFVPCFPLHIWWDRVDPEEETP